MDEKKIDEIYNEIERAQETIEVRNASHRKEYKEALKRFLGDQFGIEIPDDEDDAAENDD